MEFISQISRQPVTLSYKGSFSGLWPGGPQSFVKWAVEVEING